MLKTFGHEIASTVWTALERTYNHDSVKQTNTLRDSLCQLEKGSSIVFEYKWKLKAICDQLSSSGHPIEESDKINWFLSGLDSEFEMFFAPQRLLSSQDRGISFCDLVFQAESHALFLASLTPTTPPPVAFTTTSFGCGYSTNTCGRGSSRGGSSHRHGRAGFSQRHPHCQLCQNKGHYANQFPDLPKFVTPSFIS